jgi:hypothetical protein
VFDISSIRRFQASKVAVSAARSDVNGAEEQVAAQVARAYLAAIRGDADVETAEANVALSEAVLKQANDQKAAGTGTGIEITRARVQLANDRQRLLVAENARRSTVLQLLRAIGLRLDTELVLTDKLGYTPVDALPWDDAVTLAKGLANGLPIGALLVAEHSAGAFAPGDHGSTVITERAARVCRSSPDDSGAHGADSGNLRWRRQEARRQNRIAARTER